NEDYRQKTWWKESSGMG
ncbi:hypothetical protein A2U01_0051243, partial [Trifolium medium]|nr:hypothetical protein [Trifolium medium]